MYLLAIHVPVFRRDSRLFVRSDWARSLVLLRDALCGRFGELVVLAPERLAKNSREQRLVPVSDLGAGMRFVGAFDGECSPRTYWLKERKKWTAWVDRYASQASIVHTGMNDLYRPINFDALRIAVRSQAKVVFVRDTDEVQKALDGASGAGAIERTKVAVYNRFYDSAMRWAVSHADLSFLKGESLMARYGKYARNSHIFQDTSYSLNDVISQRELHTRVNNRSSRHSLRLVYCGRLVGRKGVDESIRALSVAQALGARVSLDLIGDGPERSALEELVLELGLKNEVKFFESVEYGPALHQKLRTYDALLFTPKAEDTPRMIFDGYAAGLPLLGYRTTYNAERARGEGAARLVPLRDHRAAGELLHRLAGSPMELANLSLRARKAGLHHCAERWYKKRAELTFALEPVSGIRPRKLRSVGPTMVA